MRHLRPSLALGALIPLMAACGGANTVDGTILGEGFGKAREAIFVGDLSGEEANLRLMIASFENACQNYSYYVESQQYDAENAFADPDDPAPRYLLFTVYLQGQPVAGDWPILPPGEFYEGSTSFISGRYSLGDGEGAFDPTLMNGGSLVFEDVEADTLLGGTFTAGFTSGDSLEGSFEATYCDP